MGDMDNFNLEAPKRCPRCGEDIMIKPVSKPCFKVYICPECGELYNDEHLGVWRIRTKEKV